MTSKNTEKRKARALQDALSDRGWSYMACLSLLRKHNGDEEMALVEALRGKR